MDPSYPRAWLGFTASLHMAPFAFALPPSSTSMCQLLINKTVLAWAIPSLQLDLLDQTSSDGANLLALALHLQYILLWADGWKSRPLQKSRTLASVVPVPIPAWLLSFLKAINGAQAVWPWCNVIHIVDIHWTSSLFEACFRCLSKSFGEMRGWAKCGWWKRMGYQSWGLITKGEWTLTLLHIHQFPCHFGETFTLPSFVTSTAWKRKDTYLVCIRFSLVFREKFPMETLTELRVGFSS